MPTSLSRYTSLVGGVIIQIVIGSIFITGNACLYLSSHLQNQNINVTTKDLSILISFQVHNGYGSRTLFDLQVLTSGVIHK